MKHILVPVDLLSELAESLACELDARYPASVRSYESQDRKYQAEMEPVLTARKIIAAPPAVQGELVITPEMIVAGAAEQQPTRACACTVPDDCETLHWRGQILSMNELASVAQPAAGEEIMVNTPYDVFILPLQPSGLLSGPRFVVHVPQTEARGSDDVQLDAAMLRGEFAAALDQARVDAKRWRALREMDGGEIYALLGNCDGIHPEQADAAIDQARGKGGKEDSND